MTQTLRIAFLSLTLAAAGTLLAVPQPAEAGKHFRCYGLSASAKGVTKAGTTRRAEGRLKRGIRAWAKKKGWTPKTGAVSTSCSENKGLRRWSCTASARVCKG